MTDATPTQPTGTGKLIWRKPLTEDVIEFGTAPDPRDARIAELEAALSSVRDDLSSWRISFPSHCSTMRTIDAALMPAPEGDMRETVEELDA